MKKEIINYIKTLSDNEKIQELLIKTIGKILLKQDDIKVFIKDNEDKIIHVRDWVSSIIENNEQWKKPRVLTIVALNNAADKYFEKKNNKLQTIELDENHEKLIADLGDYYIVQMLTPEALDNESKQMQHCIGHGYYDDKLHNSKYQYLSLRDKFNNAHITLEIESKKILQIQGKQNKVPETKYLEKIVHWLKDNDYKFNLNKIEMILNKKDNKIYSIYNIPDNCEIDGSLAVYAKGIKYLPDNLIINGNLNLTDCQKIKELPNNLVVNGDLFLGRTKIQKIPENIKIGGSLDSNYSEIKELPNNLVVNLNLVLTGSKIQKIPENIKIGRNLDLSYSEIKELPNNLVVNGYLNLSGCKNLIEIPKGLIIKGSLYANDIKIKELPNDINIEEDLILNNSMIERLPDDFIVNGKVNLSDCKNIKELPERLKLYNDLILIRTGIQSIPDDLVINGKLDLTGSKISVLPKNLQVTNLIVGNNEVIDIPNDIKIENILDIHRSKVKEMNDNIKCKTIYIRKEQIDMIKETMDIDNIVLVDAARMLESHFSKERFFNYVEKRKQLYL